METEFRRLNECRPLVNAVTPELYQNNAFRITGLGIDATTRDISKHADKLKMMFELGHTRTGAGGIMALQPPPTLHEVRAAVELLREPETRLIHELFWFWPEEFGSSHTDPAFHAWAAGNGEAALRIWTLKESNPQTGAVARHNLAVFWHLVAMDGERNIINPVDATQSATLEEYWRMSVKRWSALVADDHFWDRITMRIQQVDDPRLTATFLRDIRAGLLEALGRVHVEFALRHTTANSPSLALVHAQLVRELIARPGRMAAGLEQAMGPIKVQLRERAKQARGQCEKSPGEADELADRLVEFARPLLELLQFIHGTKENPECAELFDEVAAVCVQCASTPRPVTESRKAVLLLEEARSLAVAPGLIQHIDVGLALWTGRERLRPILEQLEKVRRSDIPPKSKLWIIRDQVLQQLGAMLTADPYNPAALETRSTIAGALREIAFAAVDELEGVEIAQVALDLASQHACYEELSRQIWADRGVIERKKQARQEQIRQESRRKVLANLAERLDAIEADVTSPKVLADRIEQEIVPYIISKIAPDQRNEAHDYAAAALRRIALSAGADYGDAATAVHALASACELVRDPDLRLQILAEKARAEGRFTEQELQNLVLRIRDDQIEISGLGVRINEVMLLADEILGVRFGSKAAKAQDRTAFQIEIAATRERQLRIDCQRLLRGKAQIAEDFERITRALRVHIAPRLAGWIGRSSRSASGYVMSETAPGLFAEQLTEGALALLIKGQLVVPCGRGASENMRLPLDQLRLQLHEGSLALYRTGSDTPVAQWRVGQVWNAVFFAEIVAAARKQSYDASDFYVG